MTKFNKGDKVVVLNVKDPVADFIKQRVGSIGTVEIIAAGWQSGEYIYDVVFDDGNGYFFFEDELESVE